MQGASNKTMIYCVVWINSRPACGGRLIKGRPYAYA